MPYKTASGKWRAEKVIEGRRKTKLFLRKEEAKRWEVSQNLEDWKAQDTPILTVSGWISKYLDFAKEQFQPRTYEAKRLAFKQLGAFVNPSEDVELLSASQILTAMRSIGGDRANRLRSEISTAWEWGVDYLGLPEANPAKRIKKFSHDAKPRALPTKEEALALIKNNQGQDRLFVIFAIHTGARKGEMLRLSWSDVDFVNSRVRLSTRKSKGGGLQYDLIPMTKDLKNALLLHKQIADDYFVFTHAGEQYSQADYVMERLCRNAGIRQLGFHSLRHLTASMLADAGMPMPQIQSILRHRNINTTSRYVHALQGVQTMMDDALSLDKTPQKVPHGEHVLLQ